MTQNDQQQAFYQDILKLVDRYSREFDLSYCSVIGALDMVAMYLSMEAVEESIKDGEQ